MKRKAGYQPRGWADFAQTCPTCLNQGSDCCFVCKMEVNSYYFPGDPHPLPKEDATAHMFGGQRGGGKIFHLETRLAEAIRERDQFENCARFYRNRCIDLEEKMTRKGEIDSGGAKKEDEDIEKAYQNGKEFARQEIVDLLRKQKGIEMGTRRALLTDVIEMIRKMEVRP